MCNNLSAWVEHYSQKYFSNPLVSTFFPDTVSSNDADNSRGGSRCDRVPVRPRRWAVLMGGSINHSLISIHFSISTYFVTVQTYKHMHPPTRVYSNLLSPWYRYSIAMVLHHFS